jgi:beta-glucosidase
MEFPKSFVWGAAAASYQVEGAAYEDGKGASVWDMFCRKPGVIRNAETGDMACDHYHRFKADVALMKQIGLKAYRLSIAWPRVIPGGVGKVNPAGLAFYDALVDELLSAGIQPYVTLFHWDYPYELYLRGGWLNADSPDWFADYTRVVVDRLSDRVKYWMTLNEPQCFVGSGHWEGDDAPGDKLGLSECLLVAQHALLAHGKAVQMIRASSRAPQSQVGMAPVGITYLPATDSPADVAAARQATFAVSRKDFWNNTWWSDPVFFKRYPEDGLALFGKAAPAYTAEDMETIGQPLDFYGANIYHGLPVRAGADGKPELVTLPTGMAHTAYPWQVTPQALYWGPRFFWERHHLPVLITENGMANADWVALDGQVHDPQRIDFTARYLAAIGQAIRDGVDVAGYFHWSIMDNFEWTYGYLLRFGLIYVDFNTQQRWLKDSARWYGQVIAANGSNLPE